MKVKMKIKVNPAYYWVYVWAGVILFLLTGVTECKAQRDRNKHSLSSNFDLMGHRFSHDYPDDHYGSLHHDDSHLHPQGACEPITVGLCMGIGYNETAMPNALGHDTQTDAEALLQTYSPLIQYGCHSNLKLFLCSAHVPMCTDKVPQPIGPCRSLCESVKQRCEPVLREFGFGWPESLECSKFPAKNSHENLCNPGPAVPPSYRAPVSSSLPPRASIIPHNQREEFTPPNPINYKQVSASSGGSGTRQSQGSDSSLNKQNGNIAVKNIEMTSTKEGECMGPRKVWSKGSCYLKCSAASLDTSSTTDGTSLFHPSEKSFARNYALLWAVLSLSAAFIALTLSVCSPRFSVAERPILYLALCQVFYSIGVIIGSTSTVSCFVDKASGSNLLARGGMIPSSCAFVFLLTYFFGTATTMWWVILSLAWFLSLNRSVASTLLHKESSLFHLVTWGVASILTSTALVHKKVDADELTGICGVGFQDTEALSLYNLIPLSISLSIGLIFLLFGLIVRIFFPNWNLPLCHCRCCKKGKNPSSTNQRMVVGCELSNNSVTTTTASHHGRTHNMNGYSPVFVGGPPLPSHPPPPHPSAYHHHGYSNCQVSNIHPNCSGYANSSTCMCNNNALLYSTGNSPASIVGVGMGFQRLRVVENTKAIWMRIGIFALVHSLPIACQVGTMVYELNGKQDWERGKERPNLQIFLLRLNMNLIAGLTTGVWVLSTYSWKSMLTFTRKLCNCLQFPPRSKTKSQNEHKVPVPNSVVTPLLHQPHPPIPIPSGSSGSSSNNHNSTMPILSSNNTFTTRGALAPHNIPSASNCNFPVRSHPYNHPLPPVPPRNPDHIALQQQQQWRRGETIV